MNGGASSSPSSRATRRRRRLGGLAAGTLLGAGALALPGVAAAPGGGAPGTLHVLVAGTVGHRPQVGCEFRVDLSGFDGVLAVVTVSPHGRSAALQTLDVELGGGAGGVDVVLLPAELASLRPGPQGVHLEVEATTAGGTRKSAVIWADCAPATDDGGPDDETDGPDAGNSDGTPGGGNTHTGDDDADDDETEGPGNSDGTPGGGNTNPGGNDDDDGPGNSDGTPGGSNPNTGGNDDEDGDVGDVGSAGEVKPTPVVVAESVTPAVPAAPASPFKAVLGISLESPAPAAVVDDAAPAAEAVRPTPAAPQPQAAATLPRTGASAGTATIAALGLIVAGIVLVRFRRRPGLG